MVVELTGTTAEFLVESSSSSLELIARLIIAALLGAMVGIERQLSHKPAGLRTHMLVSMGSALFTLLAVSEFQSDPARVAAGIVTGIGFIGAGTIIAGTEKVQGITTAATLWTAGGIGLAAGSGSYFLAVVAAILVFAILQIRRIEKYFK